MQAADLIIHFKLICIERRAVQVWQKECIINNKAVNIVW